MAQKAVELILMRQLASYLAVPIFLVDPEGNRLLDEARGTAAFPFDLVAGTEGLSMDVGAARATPVSVAQDPSAR
jgi:hypothetical protein